MGSDRTIPLGTYPTRDISHYGGTSGGQMEGDRERERERGRWREMEGEAEGLRDAPHAIAQRPEGEKAKKAQGV